MLDRNVGEARIGARVGRLGRTSIGWAFDAYNVATGEHLAGAIQTLVAVDPIERRPVPVSPRVRAAVVKFEQEVLG